ncbi:MAG TPA: NifU family protein [Burkholderiales bacterium]|nr:NifU family protein [Burkholderiales bacterium]
MGGVKLDAPFYTEEELDALYESDPVAALRISREQHALKKQLEARAGTDANAPPPTEAQVRAVLEEARGILTRDGGDLEFVSLAEGVLRVRMKGACAGCPRGPLDLRNVVERLVRARLPAIRRVENTF